MGGYNALMGGIESGLGLYNYMSNLNRPATPATQTPFGRAAGVPMGGGR
jgi:hypothetical protein